ncbi:MAG TPA: hypothetical protein VGZ73_08740, partial [Bryobacteraceae bacterium]|nr:hypothetical protein [Bryobacteraceae bacterium]
EQVGSQVEARAAALEQSITALVANAVEGEVGAAIPGAVESAVRTAVAASVSTAIESRLPDAICASMEPMEQQLRLELEQRDHEIAELRRRLADTDTKVLELILGIGQICRQAADKIVPPMGPQERGGRHGQSPSSAVNPVPNLPNCVSTTESADLGLGPPAAAVASRPPGGQENGNGEESQNDRHVPGSAQAQEPNGLWRVPLVSSLVLATGGLVLRHFL